ncbi:MAG: DegV family protein [Lachnospiraceae bacterium]|jgi:DegV family protein with EDD domain|nr:DegV family protein [Lachnospiraceae bacterium]
MGYKIILDSCGELPEEFQNDSRFERVPLRLDVGDYHILDDENFNQKEFLQKVAEYPKCPGSSCPSPERYMEACRTEAEHVYIVTLSSHLSGSYNSAELGRKLYREKHGEKQICIVDSQSASGGQTQIGLLAMELEEAGVPFEEIEKRLNAYRDEMKTYFVLDNLETLRKNGRLSEVKSMVAQTLNIKPVMSAKGGIIIQKSQAIGMKKALMKIRDYMLKEVAELNERRIVITHCNCPDRAEYLKGLLKEKARLKEVVIMDTAGVSSMYANDGGIIVTA